MEDTKVVRMAKLNKATRKLIIDKFKDCKKVGQKVIKFPQTDDIWLLIPEGTPESKTKKLQSFMQSVHNPRQMYKTKIPAAFLKAAV